VEELESLIENNLGVKFRCEPAGAIKGEFVANTTSILSAGSDEEQLHMLNEALGVEASNFIEFFKKYNGAVFFQDNLSDTSALKIHPISEWNTITEEAKEWYEMLDEEELEEAGIDWLESCVAFAEVPHSGNYFVVALDGVSKGKIIYSDHDGLESEVYANSIVEFLSRFLSNPVEEMEHLGCFTRYDDGESELQWIPVGVV